MLVKSSHPESVHVLPVTNDVEVFSVSGVNRIPFNGLVEPIFTWAIPVDMVYAVVSGVNAEVWRAEPDMRYSSI